VLTAAKFVEAAGTGNLLSFDMGGTTAKVCLIEDGKPVVTGQFEFDMVNLKKNSGLPISIPAIELVEVGSGGGSLARTEMGAIVVGPESAGSKPGPMCYGLGGTRPTVTDADLVLGYLNPDYFLGGQMKLDLDAAKRGIELEIAGPLGLGVEAAAWGIHEVVTAQMAQAARVVSVGRGKDPREFVLVAFGGAGPVHGVRLASMLGVRRAVFPVGAGVASAIGLLMADPAFDLVRTSLFPLEAGALVQVNAVFADLEAQAKEQLRAGALSGAVRTERSCDMRFAGQGYEINVPLPAGPYAAEDLPHLHEVFFAAYAATYGDRAFNRDDPVVGVHWRLRAVVERPPFHFAKAHQGDGKGTAAFKGTRPVYFPETDGFVDCPIFERSRLGAGDRVAGPAVIEERESTIVLIPASEARVDQQGNVVVTISN
jgi:N-methylhydantoinase A